MPEDPMRGRPGYTRTTGLQSAFVHPDLIVFGLEGAVAQRLLADLAEQVVEGVRLDAEQTIEGVASLPLSLRPTDGRLKQHVRDGLPGGADFLQIVWPDRTGTFPWEEGYDETQRSGQPLLFGIELLARPISRMLH